MSRQNKKRKDDSESSVGPFLFKLGSKLLLSVVIILAILTLTQCTVKKPESPSWTTNFVVPVVNRTYDMQELVARMDQDGISIDSNGSVVFSITEDLDTVGLNQDEFRTDDISYSLSENLGVVDIDKPALDPVVVNLSDLSGLSLVFPGDSAIIPDTSFSISSDLPTISTFTTATVHAGQIDITITNELGLDLDNINVDLAFQSTGVVIVSGTYPDTLRSGSSGVVSLPLDGEVVPNELTLVTSYHTPTDTVYNFSTRYIESSFSFPGALQVSSAVAQIPALSRADTSLVALAESNRIDSALLESGFLNLTIYNQTSLDATVTIEAPDFVSNGLTLAGQVPVAGGATENLSLDLTGHALVPQSSVVPQEIKVLATASSPGSGSLHVSVDQADSFSVEAALTNLSFSSITGLFQSVTADLGTIIQDIDVPTGLENVELANARIVLEIENALDLPGDIDISLTGNNGKATAFSGTIAPAGLAASATSTIVNDTAAAFLSPIPTSITASGTVTFGDGSYVGTLTKNDYVFGRVTFESPLEIIINPSTVDTDIESEEIDQADIDVITDHFISGRFVYQLTNHLPLGAHMNIFFGPDSASLYTSPQLRFDSLYINAAPVDASGLVTDTAQTAYQEIYLDNDDIRVLENSTLYIGQQIILNGSDGQVVKFTANDYVQITGRIEVEYLFDGEF